MTLNRMLTAALSPIAPTEADTYEGKKPVYLTFHYNTLPADFGDDMPDCERALVQVHLFAPRGWDSLKTRAQVKRAVAEALGAWPSCTNASDKTGQHFIFECETALPLEGAD